jgi:glycine/D-amino acid oxidase-like deaminating enzyme
MMESKSYDVVVIGGGFYGALIASFLRQRGYAEEVLLIEREGGLLKRASYNNQARIHNGYHYPRSFTTAYRSRVNFSRFIRDWQESVYDSFTSVYAIARRDSKVGTVYFERFCESIGAKICEPDRSLRQLFNESLIEGIFVVEELVFDASKLAERCDRLLRDCGVQVMLNTEAESISMFDDKIKVGIRFRASENGYEGNVLARYVFNCTYSMISHVGANTRLVETDLKHEITEVGLIKPPKEIQSLGVTVMDGPFFSVMPFPARSCHSITHVRYTPHMSWKDSEEVIPYEKLRQYHCKTKVHQMIRDASRYMPVLSNSEYIESIFELKTLLLKNESDDGRPILLERCRDIPNLFSVLGGKIDNIYDILEKIESDLIVDGKLR